MQKKGDTPKLIKSSPRNAMFAIQILRYQPRKLLLITKRSLLEKFHDRD